MKYDLNDLRQSIDNIDNAVLALLTERFRLTEKVGRLKRVRNLPAVDPKRESEQFTRLNRRAQEAGLNPDLAIKLWRLIIDEVVKNHNAK